MGLILKCSLVTFLLAGWATAHAADKFQLLAEPLRIPERGAVLSYAILTESNKFGFIPPVRWNVQADPPAKTVTLLSPDVTASITLSFLPGEAAPAAEPDAARVRREVLARFPGARVTAEFRGYTTGTRCRTLDLKRVVNEQAVASRVAVVAYPHLTVQLNLTTSAERFAAYHQSLGQVMASFRREALAPLPPANQAAGGNP